MVKAAIIKSLMFLVIAAFFHQTAQAQRCATHELHQQNQNQPGFEPVEDFEQWLQLKIAQRKYINQNQGRIEANVLRIPIVVHIIHNGESLGTGMNIADDQILAQIKVLNEDFRRTNPDSNMTLAEFKSVAADTEIEFVLARQDPEGLPTSGIVRVNGGRTQWKWTDQVAMKALSYWPAEEYMNLWVTNLVGENNDDSLLGYAQYPVSTLPGLDTAQEGRLLDGVAMDFQTFGSAILYPAGDYRPKYDRGRTTTHEVGHFLGLRHVWGDISTCDGTDYCSDTPSQLSQYTSCPTSYFSCNSNDMFQNFMDYTPDACMNLFTLDQMNRMRTVLSESPRRASLVTSRALNVPVIANNDAGIFSIEEPTTYQCPGIFNPQLTIKNYGSNILTSTEINIYINQVLTATKQFPLNLFYLESAIVDFDPVNLNSKQSYDFKFEIISANGVGDEKSFNNTDSLSISTPSTALLPLEEGFDNLSQGWTILNPDNQMTWALATAPLATVNNTALKMDYYNYEHLGEVDMVVSPVFDLTTSNSSFLHFDVAYGGTDFDADALLVGVARNCKIDLSSLDTIYYKSGGNLATALAASNFTPSNATQWRTESYLDLSKYLNSSQVQLVFMGKKGTRYSSNLYIDNIVISTVTNEDIALSEVISPGQYACEVNPVPVVQVQNKGTSPLTSFLLKYRLDGTFQDSISFSNLNVLPGDTYTATFPKSLNMSFGDHTLELNISQPNGKSDENPSNNTLAYNFSISDLIITPPYRLNYDSDHSKAWKSLATADDLQWRETQGMLQFPGYNNPKSGGQAWYISPMYDFSDLHQGSLFFDVSYPKPSLGSEELLLLASTDCGKTFPYVLYQKEGNNLATTNYTADFTPLSADDWQREFIILNTFAGEEQMRFAFLINNGSENNLYLDNVEIYLDDDPTPLHIDTKYSTVYPNPTGTGKFHLTFSLPEKENVGFMVTDNMGRKVYQQNAEQVLNQTFEIDLSGEGQGLYLVKITGETFSSVQRVFINH
ncbi:MAG: M43 family zinc metalloprotease [Cyclobacteriaceae bacterium]|nr:M43 family zinc metalloprotease [Cyclobacteriaceae bacterium]